jgi:hypothetical protein
MRDKKGGEALDWGALVPRLVHPTKVMVIEALRWIDRPLSASDLERVFDAGMSVSTISCHVTNLADIGILKPARKLQVRGAWKTIYRFAHS